MEKILTIVIPTYNMQDYLRRCLDSLIVPEEQMKQLEVLVINDGSKDNSSAIAHEYQDMYPDTFRVIDKENGNYGSCVNRGLKEATGKYIKILDADDWFDTKNLSAFIDRLQNTDVDVVLTDYKIYKQHEKTVQTNLMSKTDYVYSVEEAFAENKWGIIFVQMHTLAYKHSCFDGIDYHQTEGISYTDQEWNLIPWAKVQTLLYLPISVYQYNLAREGQTCDLKVFFKKMPEQFVSICNTIEKVSDLKSMLDEFHRTLLFDKIASRAETLYRALLVSEKSTPAFLVDFDKRLVEQYADYANALADKVLHRYFKYHYIRNWRKSHYKPIPAFVLLYNKTIEKIVALCKNIVDVPKAQKPLGGGNLEYVICQPISIMSNPINTLAA